MSTYIEPTPAKYWNIQYGMYNIEYTIQNRDIQKRKCRFFWAAKNLSLLPKYLSICVLKNMSAVYMSIPLLPKDQAYCSPVYLKKAWQVDGSTALTGLNIYPVIVPGPGAPNTHFLRAKMHLLGAVQLP